MNFIFITMLSWLTMFVGPTKSQDLNYQILFGDKQVGTLTVQPTNFKDDTFSITMEANMSFPLMDINSVAEAKYSNDKLLKATNVQKVNGKVRESSKVTCNGDHYLVHVDKESHTLREEVRYSVAMLYHFEPKGVKKVFSERFGEFSSIKEIAPNQYELQTPDGKKNKYTYKNGVCIKMETNHLLSKVTFRLEPEDLPASGK